MNDFASAASSDRVPRRPGECVRCMFWNNLGCIHFAMGKHNLGIFYFKKALQENDHTCAQLGDGSSSQGKHSVPALV